MTDMTDDEKDAAAKAFMELIEANAPESLTDEQLVTIMGTLITMYATNIDEAGLWVMALARGIRDYYLPNDDADNERVCHCPTCTENRKTKFH